MKTIIKTIPILLAALMGLTASAPVQAGGYDTPILYSARHMGMGGTAISFVDDPSALFHNPAGLSHTKFISLTANVSPLMGTIQSSPDSMDQNLESELTFAPFFLVGSSFRVTDWMTLGLGAYPVASAGATYKYTKNPGTKFSTDLEDRTKLVFIEVSPGVSFDLPYNIRIGAGYRVSIVTFERYKGPPSGAGGTPTFDMELKGVNFAGFRAGLQWQPLPELQLGMTYRHKTTTTTEGDSSILIAPLKRGKTTMDVVLPSKLGAGIRYDVGPVGIATDFEWTFNSQNNKVQIKTKANDVFPDDALPNTFKWSDAMTVRVGTEYRFLDNYRVRLGYIFDDKTGNENYPTAFGTPPTPTHSFTTGLGYKAKNWEVNLAYAYRMGSTSVAEPFQDNPNTSADESLEAGECRACSKGGDYNIKLHGMYADFSWYFD